MAWGTGTTAADASAYEGPSAGMGGGPREDNIGFYLDDALTTADAFKAEQGKQAAMDATQQANIAASQPLAGIAALSTGKHRPVPGYELKVLPSAQEFIAGSVPSSVHVNTGTPVTVPGIGLSDTGHYTANPAHVTGHLDKLQAQHPSWRTPTPFFYDESLGNYPFQKAPGPGAIGSSLAYGSYREPSYSQDARLSSGSPFSPVEKFTAINAATGKPYTEKDGVTPHLFESQRSSNVQPLKGDIPLSIGGVAEEGVKAPGFPTTHSFMPNQLHGVYNALADISPSSTLNYNPTRMQDLIRINADTVKELVRKGFPADEIEQHESWHLANHTLANNVGMWGSKVDFTNPVTGKTEKLLDVISKVDKATQQRIFNRPTLHIAIFGYDPQFLDEPIKNRYNNHPLFNGKPLAEKMKIARALGAALNEAALLVDNIRTNQKQHMLFWNSMTDLLLNGKPPEWSSEQ